MRIDVVSLFPAYFLPLNLSLLGRAQQAGLIELVTHDLRDFTSDRHRSVDDSPYGGGPGMVLRPEPWGAAIDHVLESAAAAPSPGPAPLLLVPTPAGEPFRQALAQRWSTEAGLLIACGRYEGIDQRVIEDARLRMRVVEVSIGDYVVNGGEVAALAIIEAVARLLPGVVGNDESLVQESHNGGLLEAPSYTKPELWREQPVPKVLLSGHHFAIEKWRREQSLRRTAALRPDLIVELDPARTTSDDRAVLQTCGWQITAGRFSLAPGSVAD